MTKVPSIIFAVLWMLALPIAVLAIGFAGNRLWSPAAVYDEIAHGRPEGVVIRIGLLIYAMSPILVFRSYQKNRR